jgi:hypothetical protein
MNNLDKSQSKKGVIPQDEKIKKWEDRCSANLVGKTIKV